MKLRIKEGFALLEFSVTIALILLFSCIFIVPYKWMSQFFIRAEIDSLMHFFSYMQQKAVAQGDDLDIIFDIENQSYHEKSAEGNYTHFLQDDVCLCALEGVKGPPSLPQSPVQKPITFVNNTVTFYKTGIISSGVIYIADTKNQIQYAISNAVASVSYLRLYQYTKDEKWVLV